MNDSPARTDPETAAIGRPTRTARRLVEASVSPNTRRASAGALRRLDAWLDGRELDDVALAAYLLAELHDAWRASSSSVGFSDSGSAQVEGLNRTQLAKSLK